MASVRELKTKWQLRYYDSHRIPKEATDSFPKDTYTEREAIKEAEYRQQLYDRGEYDPWTQAEPGAAAKAEDDPTLQELAELYTQEKRRMGRAGMAGGWTEKTYKSDGPILKNFARKTGPNLQASRLRTSHIRSFVYQDQLANATKRGYHRRVRAMLRWAEEQGLLPDPPTMPPPKKTETRTEVLTEAELEAICTAHRGIQHTTRRHCPMWRFLFYQGLRPGEMYELRIRNVGLGAGEIQIGDPDWRQKSGQEDVIPLLPPGRFYARPFLSGAACVGRVPLAESGRSGVRRRLGCQPAILELQACRASGRGRR